MANRLEAHLLDAFAAETRHALARRTLLATGFATVLVAAAGTMEFVYFPQRASALPYLMIGLHSSQDYVGIILSNDGVGPALIRDVHVEEPGRLVAGDGRCHVSPLYTKPRAQVIVVPSRDGTRSP